MIEWYNYADERWCKNHFQMECPQCVRQEEEEKEKNKEKMKQKKYFEVKAADVHKLVCFLQYGLHNIKTVKFCPKCLMPNLVGSHTNTSTVICDTCDALWMSPDKELMELDVESYLAVIKSLPLVNRGQIILSLQEKLKYKDSKPVTYDDLTEEDLHKYDAMMSN